MEHGRVGRSAGPHLGFVGDDLRFDTNPTSPWYGQPLALTNIPVGVYDYTGRLITMLHTDTHGFYDVVLPSTQTYNCPTPSGVCPGTYVLRIDDPADTAFNPDYLTAALAFDVWPGKTTYADTPVDPISALTCNLSTVPDPAPGEFGGYQFPEFWRVGPNPYVAQNWPPTAATRTHDRRRRLRRVPRDRPGHARRHPLPRAHYLRTPRTSTVDGPADQDSDPENYAAGADARS